MTPIRIWSVLLLAAAAVSVAAPLTAAIAVPALAIAWWRNLLGALAFAPWGIRSAPVPGTPGERWRLGAAGVLLAAHFALWIGSLRLTSVAAATALGSMQAVAVLVIGRLGPGRADLRPRVAVWWGAVVATAGAVIIAAADLDTGGWGGDAWWGDLAAIGSSICLAGVLVLGAPSRHRLGAGRYNAVLFGIAAASLTPVVLLAGTPMVGFALADWLGLLALVVVAQLLGHGLFNLALGWVPPSVVATVMLAEVPGAALLAAWWLDERPDAAALMGAALVVAGLALVVRGTPTGQTSAPV